MTIRKIAVSLPGPLVDRAQQAVRKGRARSVSAYVASALEEKSKLDELEELLEQMLAETGGPLSPGERDAADAALGSSRLKPRKKARR
jgi:Arc/MetJ-type ribon-helix-helix transcriptional regulator